MDSKFSKSWINMRIHYDTIARSGILNEFIEKNNLKQNYDMIDMCTGSGSFLIWALKQGLCPNSCLLYTSPSPRDMRRSRMPSSA